MVSELVFAEPDDPLVMEVAHQMLDGDRLWNKWQTSDVASRGEVPGESEAGEPDHDLSAKHTSEENTGDDSIAGPAGTFLGTVDVENLTKRSEAVGSGVAKISAKAYLPGR